MRKQVQHAESCQLADDQLKTQNNSLQAELHSAQRKLEEHEHARSQAENQLHAIKTNHSDCADKLRIVSCDLQAAETAVSEKQAEVDRATAQQHELRQQLEQAQRRSDGVQQELQQSTDKGVCCARLTCLALNLRCDLSPIIEVLEVFLDVDLY